LLLSWVAPAAADFFPTAPLGAATFVDRSLYDYGPSAILDTNDLIQVWWCGGTTPGQGDDHILHAVYNRANGQWTTPQAVLGPVAGSEWEDALVCDPSVVRGEFHVFGQTFSYLMYYTGFGSHGHTNRIMAAFSNDGVNWTRVGQPIIGPVGGDALNTYGAGQTAIWSVDGHSQITLFWTDDTTGGIRTATTDPNYSDGIHFGPTTQVSKSGTDGLLRWNADFAFDSTTGMAYAAVPGYFVVDSVHPETYEIKLFRMPMGDLLAGSGTWERLGDINGDVTGKQFNFAPGFLRNAWGDVAYELHNLGGLTVYFGAGDDGAASDWDLLSETWRPSPMTVPLRRYASYATLHHWTTAGYVAPDYRDPSQGGTGRLDGTLGYVDIAPQSPGMKPVWSCRVGTTAERYIGGCGSDRIYGVAGWIFDRPPVGIPVVPLYQCELIASHDRFLSNLADCEGTGTGVLLGYARTSASGFAARRGGAIGAQVVDPPPLRHGPGIGG